MLDNIKSSNILKKIFGYITYRKKLNIIKLNKLIKKRLNITKEDYDIYALKEFNLRYHLNIEDINIKELDLKMKYIYNKGVEYLTKVKFYQLNKLNLSDNGISDINVFEKDNLKKLKELYLNKNYISDISILEKVNFLDLSILDLSDNGISDINVLQKVNFTKLKELNLASNKISNINVFEIVYFKKLKKLNLASNKISDADAKVFKKVKFKYLKELELYDNDNLITYPPSNSSGFPKDLMYIDKSHFLLD